MIINFPTSLDSFNLPRSKDDKNAVESSVIPASEDVWYILKELERKIGINSSHDSSSLDYRAAVIEAFISAMQSLGITATPTFAGLTLTGFTISGGLITKYGNVVPVLGSILKGNGSAFVAGEPIENQNAILQPVGICPPINQTDVRAVGADTTYCIYVGWEGGSQNR